MKFETWAKKLDAGQLDVLNGNDLGIRLKRITPFMVAKIAHLTGDDEQPPGSLFFRKYQLRCAMPIINCVLEQKPMTFAEEWPRQSAKTTTLAHMCAMLSTIPTVLMPEAYPHLRHGIRIGLYGPTRPKAEKIRDKIKTILEHPFYRDVLNQPFEVANGTMIRLPCNSSITVGTANENASCIEQPSYHFVVTEETQAMSSRIIIKSIRPMVSATNGVIAHIGTASDDPKFHGIFYEMMKEGEELTRVGKPPSNIIKLSLEEVFRTPGTQRYRKFVLGEIKKFGWNNPYIQANYFGVWDFETGVLFIRPEMLTRLRDGKSRGMFSQYHSNVVAGIDVAKAKDDTVVTILDPAHVEVIDNGHESHTEDRKAMVVGWLWLRGTNYPEQARRIKKFFSHYPNLQGGLIDPRGPGEGLKDALIEDLDDKLGSFPQISSWAPTAQDMDAAWYSLLDAIQKEKFTYPAEEIPERFEFERQTTELTRRKDIHGNVRIDHPRNDSGRSDFPVSLIYAMMAAGGFDTLDIAQGSSSIGSRKASINNHLNTQ